jgi:hypothetical protein
MKMIKNILLGLIVLVFIFCGWLLYEYKQVAAEAEAQIIEDVLWLELSFDGVDTLAGVSMNNIKHLETKLIHQSIDGNNKFLRHYRSLFIRDGKKSCLETEVSYLNRNPNIEQQIWLNNGSACTE